MDKTKDIYLAHVREKVITDFIRDNQRRPSDYELLQAMNAAKERYDGIHEVGFAGFDLAKPRFGASSSAQDMQGNYATLHRDQRVFDERVAQLSDVLESSFRGFIATAKRTNRHLRELESRVDNILINNSKADVFVAGVEEEFVTQDKILWDETDAAVENGYATIGRSSYEEVDLSDININFSILAPRGVLAKKPAGPIENLKYKDGTNWEYLVYTDYEQGRVTLALELDLIDATTVGDVKLNLSTLDVNKRMTATCLYSVDGSTFAPIEPVETVVDSESLVFNLGIDNVQRIQILLSKEAYDTKTPSFDQRVYIFSIDNVVVRGAFYKERLSSTMTTGPYSIYDHLGYPVNFTKAKIEACTIEPDETSVNFFLSNDGVTFKPVSHNGQGLNFVAFGDGTPGDSAGYINAVDAPSKLQESSNLVREVDYFSEALLNTYILEGFGRNVPFQSIVVKRNILNGNYGEEILGARPGWSLDPGTNRYRTTVYIEAPEGRKFNFGPKPIWVNGFERSGIVKLHQGYTTVEVADANWVEIPSAITSLTDLKKQDPLYPFNHKALLEGYVYPSSYSGDTLYTGVDEYFGIKLDYIPPDLFSYLTADDPEYYTSYTIEQIGDAVYFKVKVDKTDATWKAEAISVDWVVQRNSSNQVWMKALLSSGVAGKTPTIESIKVRVI